MPKVRNKKEESVSEKDLNTALQFAYNFMEYSDGMSSQTLITPNVINEILKRVNNNYSSNFTEDTIQDYLSDVNSNEDNLRKVAIALEIQNMFYKRIIQFNSNLLAYNMTWDCYNIDDTDFDDKQFNKDLDVVKEFLNRFDAKENFSMCHRQMLRQGAIAVSIRDDFDKIILQELPLDYTKIIGRDSYGILFAFDFNWFLSGISDINSYKKVFKSMELKAKQSEPEKYTPENPTASYIHWVNCDRKDGFWYFKPNMEIATLVPYYSAIFPDLSMQPVIRRLQKNKDIIAATKIIIGNIQMMKEQKSGNLMNQTAFDSKSIGQFMGHLRNGIAKEIGIGIMPSDDVKAIDFSVQDKDIYTDFTTNSANQTLGSSSSILSKDKLNAFESKLALDIDANFAKSFYNGFEKLAEYWINSKTKKYKFSIKYKDINTADDVTDRLKRFNELATTGIIRWDLLARGLDENIFEFERKLKYSHHLELNRYLTPLMSLYNQSPNDVGRPRDDRSDNDNTVASHERESENLNSNTL